VAAFDFGNRDFSWWFGFAIGRGKYNSYKNYNGYKCYMKKKII